MTADPGAFSLSEFGSRGAVFAAASLVIAGTALGWWWWRTRRIVRAELAVPVRILVTGSRGKSSVVRLLHAALLAAGHRPYGKVTGTHAAEIATDGSEAPTRRTGQISVLEMLDTAGRATSAPEAPNVLVEESMGVTPHLIGLIAERMARPTITVITNALHDHLEEEGDRPEAVADSLAAAIGPDTRLVVTGETQPGPLAHLRRHAGSRSLPLVETRRDPAPAWARDALPHAHPANVAMALAVTRHLGIPDETAVRGMRTASREPVDRLVIDADLDGFAFTYLDLGSVNDVDSLRSLLPLIEEHRRGRPIVAEIVSRWDRPLRALQFAGFVQPDRWAGVILVGEAAYPVRRRLIQSGFPRDRILGVTLLQIPFGIWRRRVDRFIRHVEPGAAGCLVVRLENIHDPVADRMLASAEALAAGPIR